MEAILFTGGIGDIITLESFMTDAQRNNVKSIFYATRAQKSIQQLITSLPNFPNLAEHIILWDDFSKNFAFHTKEEVVAALINKIQVTSMIEKNKKDRLNMLLKQVRDYSISKIFAEIPHFRTYQGSSFIKYKIADIDKFSLPNDYFVICPYSPNDKRNGRRDFDKNDWDNIIQYLKKRNIVAVVLNIGNDPIPTHDKIIDLSNKSNILESIEILKNAKGYYGIDSCLSVIASKLFDDNNLLIKSNNNHCYTNKHIYYAPKKTFKFLTTSVPVIKIF